MQHEKCESEVANLLASLDNLPEDDVNAKIEVLCDIIAVQDRQVEELRKKLEGLKPKPLLVVPVKR